MIAHIDSIDALINGMKDRAEMNSDNISLYASSASRIEGESLRQLERVAVLPGMIRVAGFPDLHPGKGSPVGAAMLSRCSLLFPQRVLPATLARPKHAAKIHSISQEEET